MVLQSNFRGYKERKKFKERKKTLAGAELELPNQEEGKERANDKQEDVDDEDESTYEAEENNDSDNTEVPEDEEHTEVADEAVIQDAQEEGHREDEEETKAATVLQSNFRGHKERKRLQEEGKIPAKKQKTTEEEESRKQEEEPDQDEAKAAVVLQSNFRGHKERKRLQEEGRIPKKQKESSAEEKVELTGEENVENPADPDEEKAATVLQSNFRGHRDRKRLKADKEKKVKEDAAIPEEEVDVSDVEIERRDEEELEKEQQEEEQAAVKIQSNFRGYKDRKNLKANRQAAQSKTQEFEQFSKEVMSLQSMLGTFLPTLRVLR